MSEIDKLVEQFGQQMVKDAGDLIHQDVRDIIMQSEMFTSASPDIGGELTAVDPPLSDVRFYNKQALGYQMPGLPRFGTGAMFDSISLAVAPLQALIEVGDNEKAERQQKGAASGWKDEFGEKGGRTPARPFFGVSKRALENVTRRVTQLGDDLVAAMEPLTLPTVQLNINQ